MNIKNKNVKMETTLTATITGYDYRDLKEEREKQDGTKYKATITDDNGNAIKDYSSVGVQSFVYDEEKGEGDVKIFRIDRKTTPEEMDKLVGKTIKFDTVYEKPIDKKTFYSVPEMGKEVQSEKSIFDLNKSMICTLDAVVEKEVKKDGKVTSHNTIFQVFSMNGTKLTQKNIKLKDTKSR